MGPEVCSFGRWSLCERMENMGRENGAGKVKCLDLTPRCCKCMWAVKLGRLTGRSL